MASKQHVTVESEQSDDSNSHLTSTPQKSDLKCQILTTELTDIWEDSSLWVLEMLRNSAEVNHGVLVIHRSELAKYGVMCKDFLLTPFSPWHVQNWFPQAHPPPKKSTFVFHKLWENKMCFWNTMLTYIHEIPISSMNTVNCIHHKIQARLKFVDRHRDRQSLKVLKQYAHLICGGWVGDIKQCTQVNVTVLFPWFFSWFEQVYIKQVYKSLFWGKFLFLFCIYLCTVCHFSLKHNIWYEKDVQVCMRIRLGQITGKQSFSVYTHCIRILWNTNISWFTQNFTFKITVILNEEQLRSNGFSTIFPETTTCDPINLHSPKYSR